VKSRHIASSLPGDSNPCFTRNPTYPPAPQPSKNFPSPHINFSSSTKNLRSSSLRRAASQLTRQFLQVLNPVIDASGEQLAKTCYQHLYSCRPGGVVGLVEQLKAANLENHGGITGFWSTEFSDPNQVIVISTSLAAPVEQTGKITGISTRRLCAGSDFSNHARTASNGKGRDRAWEIP